MVDKSYIQVLTQARAEGANTNSEAWIVSMYIMYIDAMEHFLADVTW